VFNTLEKHDIDLIIEIELKKLYARLTELGYKLTLSEKQKLLLQKKVLISNLVQDH
jgi:ATP-dependent Clp protease ATP-binding subunit ClpC